MKCVLIVSSGEMAEGASELHRMGYELELYPSTRDLSSLKDTREKESAAFIGREPCSAEPLPCPFPEGILHPGIGRQEICRK